MSRFAVTAVARRPGQSSANFLRVQSDYLRISPEIFSGAEAVICFVGTSRGQPSTLRSVNEVLPVAIATAAKSGGAKQFVHLSSLSVYGLAEQISVEAEESPVSNYGRSKLAGDRSLLELADRDFTVSILRVPIIYSTTMGRKLHVLAKALRLLRLMPVPNQSHERSVLHAERLPSIVEQVIARNRTGVVLGADPVRFSFEGLQALLRDRRICGFRTVRMPDWLSNVGSTLAPELWQSLYGNSVIADVGCFAGDPHRSFPGLEDIFEGAPPREC